MKILYMCLRSVIFVFLLTIGFHAHASFQLYAEHPHAPQLGALNAKSGHLEDLVLYDGAIYAGYGTHFNHSLAVQICGITPPSTSFVCETSIDSEGAAHFRLLDDNLYVAGIDPRPSSQDFYVRKSNGAWLNQPAFTGNVAHVYDIESSGGNLWVTLSKFDDDSRVMKGSDNGSWVESLFVTPETGHTSSNYSILYFIAEFQGALHTQAFDTLDGIRPYSYTSSDNGNTWVQGPSLLLHVPPSPNSADGLLNYRHEIFAGKLVMKQATYLTSFDGASAQTLRTNVRNIAKRDSYLYVLEEDGDIFRTNDLVNWSFVASAPDNATSIEVLGQDIYIGAEDGKVFRSEGELAEPEISNFFPTLYYMLIFDDDGTPLLP